MMDHTGSLILLLLFLLILMALIVLLWRLVLKEDKDSTVSYLVAGITVLIFAIAYKGVYSLFAIPAISLGTYFIGTAVWGIVSLLRKILKIVHRKNNKTPTLLPPG